VGLGKTIPALDSFFSSAFGMTMSAIQSDSANGRGGLGMNIDQEAASDLLNTA
jgi:hypothetical protein